MRVSCGDRKLAPVPDFPNFGCVEQLAGAGGQQSVECVVPLSAPVPVFPPGG